MRDDIMLNPEPEFVKGLKKRIRQNNGYCVSQLEKNPDTKCPCKLFRDTGECMCGMYIHDPCAGDDAAWEALMKP